MPDRLFELGKQRVKNYSEVSALLNNQPDAILWSDFCQMIDRRDTHRKNRIFDFVPEFEQYWTKQ
jgi:hypothetical protein